VIAGWDAIDRIVALANRTDIARAGNNANPGRLALIQHASLAPLARRAGGSGPTLRVATPGRRGPGR